ncbi:MAG: helix-hairpin-helix domain-containing protein [Paludibacter sp.]|nr:helix-hairpin-helix domain-containing protein [Bacteroidales bacterium]MCM1068452.1 helix-hairpin-helix domain-containing protein [Prevotella sp.]MCM1353406.1 helix-hairpin-helix domain-containing protein [Bacteroides sp.]MCM1442567.1 helix-hairpin-helix domain-containing protein [Muribaculum sp.]MCM1481412.1 helix-hairpin-helix domain-containing protein [Paludibacter sp.]
MHKQHPHNTWLTPQQLIGALILLILCAGIIMAVCLLHHALQQPSDHDTLVLTQQKAIQLENSLKERQTNYEKKYYRYQTDTITLTLQPFDPNTADSLTLRQLGLPAWMIKNIMNYRAKGGCFRTKESFLKVYGMTTERYTLLEPYITIDTTLLPQQHAFSQTFPIKKDTIIDLNACDTASLQLIRGIGHYKAMQIIRYRQQLGGYATPAQLLEIKEIQPLPDTILRSFFACTDSIHPIRVNHSRTEQLQRHPYLSFTQAKALYELRRELFRLHSIDQLHNLECFTDTDILRLQPYLSFED